jgi:hypothetical protein
MGAPIANLGVVKEMLDDLDNQSVAGQRYIMEKVVGFLGPQVRGQSGVLGNERGRFAERIMEEMAHEAARLAPVIDTFRGRAETLFQALGSARTG